jgi:hypothetical protein
MSKNKAKKKKTNKDARIESWPEIDSAVRLGASAQSIALKFNMPIEKAAEIISELADGVKSSAIDQRIMLRQLMRDQVPSALGVLSKIAAGKTTEEDIQKVTLQFKAADAIIKAASRFMDEDILRGWFEKPTNRSTERTIFEFGAEVDGSGATTHFLREGYIDVTDNE